MEMIIECKYSNIFLCRFKRESQECDIMNSRDGIIGLAIGVCTGGLAGIYYGIDNIKSE